MPAGERICHRGHQTLRFEANNRKHTRWKQMAQSFPSWGCHVRTSSRENTVFHSKMEWASVQDMQKAVENPCQLGLHLGRAQLIDAVVRMNTRLGFLYEC